MSWAPGGVTAPRRPKAPGCCWPHGGHKLRWRFLGSSPRGWELVPWCPGDLGCFGLSHSCLRCLTAVSSDSLGLSLLVWHSPAPLCPLPHGGVDLGTRGGRGALLLVWPGCTSPAPHPFCARVTMHLDPNSPLHHLLDVFVHPLCILSSTCTHASSPGHPSLCAHTRVHPRARTPGSPAPPILALGLQQQKGTGQLLQPPRARLQQPPARRFTPLPAFAPFSSTTRRSWTCLTAPATPTRGTANPTSKSTRMPAGASTPPASPRGSSARRTRWVRHRGGCRRGVAARDALQGGQGEEGPEQSSPRVVQGEVGAARCLLGC